MSEQLNGTNYRFTIKPGAASGLLEAMVNLALRETELIFGKARLKLETSCELSPKKTSCVIEGGTECGEHVAKLVSGFLLKQVGDEGFTVERLPKKPPRRS